MIKGILNDLESRGFKRPEYGSQNETSGVGLMKQILYSCEKDSGK